MTLTIDLPPEQERLLRQEATINGMDANEYARKLLMERLENGKPKINFFNRNATSEELARNRAALHEMLCLWREEDETDDPQEIAAREREWEEFKQSINENHSSDRIIYP